MSNEKGACYIRNTFYYNKNTNLYYKESVRGTLILAWISINDVDIWESHVMVDSPEELKYSPIIKSFNPENKENIMLLKKILYDKDL